MARRSSSTKRNLPPLLMVPGAFVLLLAVLPSSLNLPQTNPTETLEYAPVPPDGSDAPPAVGNLASLGLASGRGVGDSEADGPTTTVPEPDLGDGGVTGGKGRSPSNKRCVGSPPRQTEDPLSPPCVGFFEGDNGGATYQGVTDDEIKVLFTLDPYGIPIQTSRGAEEPEYSTYDDLGQPAKPNEFVWSRMLRVWQRYFNERFQTYGRKVHFYVYYMTGEQNGFTPEERRSDAVANYKDIQPFSVVQGINGDADAYLELMARRGVVTFLGFTPFFGGIGQPTSFFQKYPRLVWSYDPAVENRAETYVSWLCKQVVGRPASFGDAANIGKPRKLGLLSIDNPGASNFAQMAKLVKAGVEKCGGKFEVERTHSDPTCGSQCGDQNIARANIAAFQGAGVTTIVWANGFSQNHPALATAANYFPEWVQLGDGYGDRTARAAAYDQRQWANAVGVTVYTKERPLTERICFQAAKEADPDVNVVDLRGSGCGFYPYVRNLFTGIQVAGPRLGPTSMDKGFHAIPKIASSIPEIPACFYNTDDYTCVKDAMAEYWDPTGRDPEATSERGCWRMLEGGLRHLPGTWPNEDVKATRRPSDPCNIQ